MNTFFFKIMLLVILLASCKPEEKIKGRTWEGKLYRRDDDQELSEVKLKMSNDSLFVFANAIFGSGRDTLVLSHTLAKDSGFSYRYGIGMDETIDFILDYKVNDNREGLFIYNQDFYMVLEVAQVDIFQPNQLDYYWNKPVPFISYMYLEGTYQGTVEWETQLFDMFSDSAIGPIKIKIVFLEGFQLKVFSRAMWFNESHIFPYTIVGDMIYCKGFPKGLQVVDRGRKLISQDEEMNLVMRRVY
jgi:hypothetical protein